MWRKCFTIGFRTSAFVLGATAININEQHIPRKWDKNWDKRQPESLLSPKLAEKLLKNDEKGNEYADKLDSLKSKAERHIILIRHGQYNMDGSTDSKRGLTDLGQKQARETGVRLRVLSLPYRKLISSTMQRALETTDFIRESIPMIPHTHDDILVEGAPYPPEPPTSGWKPPAKQFMEEGARIEAAFRRYFHRAPPEQTEDSYDVLVCHGNVIRYFVCRALQFPPEGWLRMSVAHSSITWLSIKPDGRVILRSLGDTGHIIPENISR